MPPAAAAAPHKQERGIYSWSAGNGAWKRRVLLSPDPKYAGKKLAAGLLAVSAVRRPRVGGQPICDPMMQDGWGGTPPLRRIREQAADARVAAGAV